MPDNRGLRRAGHKILNNKKRQSIDPLLVVIMTAFRGKNESMQWYACDCFFKFIKFPKSAATDRMACAIMSFYLINCPVSHNVLLEETGVIVLWLVMPVVGLLIIVPLVVICAGYAVVCQQSFLVTGNRRGSDMHLSSITLLPRTLWTCVYMCVLEISIAVTFARDNPPPYPQERKQSSYWDGQFPLTIWTINTIYSCVYT